MSKSIYPVCSLDRSKVKWEDHMYDQTPVELHEHEGRKMWFKREDLFAPLGAGGINGSKLRQALYLMEQHLANGGSPDVASASVIGSPQLFMSAALAKHFGGKTWSVLGVTTPDKCIKHEMIKSASWFGVEWSFCGSGFNSALQPFCLELKDKFCPKGLYVQYGITLDHKVESAKAIADFHKVGGHQVKNIPDHIETLVLPFGSANSATSFFTGLAMYPKPNLKKIVLIGIGPNKLEWLDKRLSMIGEELNLPHITAWSKNYFDNRDLEMDTKPKTRRLFGGETAKPKIEPLFEVEHHDLHSTKYYTYNDLIPASWDDIEMHPRYEGKVLTYLQDHLPHHIHEKSLFWIVGSYPRVKDMKANCPELGDEPTEVVHNDFKPKKK
ncbi:tryptophan synthase beta subunit-like PLP-dependent enzyme [Vibrio phage 1.244.A._10N.261.54.C3]|nr:tryptophan synthase beta subunit-like PLP-dependent enzyme [Vibrio phage 1.244.A._10N.261.54.C3]AUR98824.1 tryptophan synthase beta subunit-like PLP-dependent enzyme [Vibrio phage 1.255.O._10N.286.45.F1]